MKQPEYRITSTKVVEGTQIASYTTQYISCEYFCHTNLNKNYYFTHFQISTDVKPTLCSIKHFCNSEIDDCSEHPHLIKIEAAEQEDGGTSTEKCWFGPSSEDDINFIEESELLLYTSMFLDVSGGSVTYPAGAGFTSCHAVLTPIKGFASSTVENDSQSRIDVFYSLHSPTGMFTYVIIETYLLVNLSWLLSDRGWWYTGRPIKGSSAS